MGIYVNPGNERFQEAINSKIYVDKTMLLDYTNSVIETQQKYVCVSRPRRFGKTMAASMVAAYYDRSVKSGRLFSDYKISATENYKRYLNKYDVISINIQSFISDVSDVKDLIYGINKALEREIENIYTDKSYNSVSLSELLEQLYLDNKRKIVFVIDEWDSIFREKRFPKEQQERYLDYLRDVFKDRNYVALVYMTGILPIKKYGTHSALNMFDEFSMENPGVLSEYVGFTEEEVVGLCNEYKVDFEKCREWYDGYSFPGCQSVYNPKSIIALMRSRMFSDYWNQTETYEALKEYINLNFDGIRDFILEMMAEHRVVIDTGSFANDMTTFSNADDVMTLLVHLGYLAYDFERKEVYIPNNEIMQEFVTTTASGGWDEVINSVKQSKELLEATWNCEKDKVAQLVEQAHFETSHLQYNDENALSYVVSLAYYTARQYYMIIRELPSGKGFADMAFIPKKNDKPAIIVELKWDKLADTAINQIKQKKYTGILSDFAGRVILVGITYSKKTKEHTCIIEEAGAL